MAMVKLMTLAAVLFIFAVQPVSGQQRPACYDYDELMRALESNAGETKHAQGIIKKGGPSIELWRTSDGSTWTMLFIDPRGHACLIAVGEDWVSSLDTKPQTQSED
jgi:hypothetical protein